MSEFELSKEEKLVFIKKEDVFTNSKIVADEIGIKHYSIIKMIKKYKDYFSRFGKIEFMDLKSVNYSRGRPEKICLLNEPQTTFLLQRVRGSKKVIDFQANLTQQFFEMREELRKRKTAITIHIETRRTLTDSIKALPDSPHKHFKYKHYTDLVYQAVTGMTAKALKSSRGYKNDDTPQQFLTAQEIKMITCLETQVAVLIDSGLKFEQIKEIVNKKLKQKLLKVVN